MRLWLIPMVYVAASVASNEHATLTEVPAFRLSVMIDEALQEP